MKSQITTKSIILFAIATAELGRLPVSVYAFSPLCNVKNVHSKNVHVDNESNEFVNSNGREESSLSHRINSEIRTPSSEIDYLPSRREWITSAASTATAAAVLALQSQTAQASTTLIQNDPATRTTTPDIASNILCDPSVSVFKHPNKQRTVYLLGTAHISSKSAEAAAQLVRDMKPKAVFVELDAKRVKRAIPKSERADEQGKDVSAASPSSTTNTAAAAVANTSNNSSSSNTGIVAASAETIQPEQPTMSKPKPYDVRELALRKGSELLGNSIKGLYQKLESEGFNAGEGA